MKRSPLVRKLPLHAGQPLRARKKTKPGETSEAYLDALYSRAIKLRDGRCMIPDFMGKQCSGPLECSHIEGRSCKATRWDMENSLAVCQFHHRLQHDNPDASDIRLLRLLGQDHLDRLRAKYLAGIKPTADDKRNLAAEFRRIIREMEQVA